MSGIHAYGPGGRWHEDTAQPAADDLSEYVVPFFRESMGRTVKLCDVDSMIVTNVVDKLDRVSFSTPVHFLDRLGVFLAGGEQHERGQFPTPDHDTITVYPVCWIPDHTPGSSTIYRLHARSSFHGAPRYTFFEAEASNGNLWYGRMWMLFTCHFNGDKYSLALVSWMTEKSSSPYKTDKRTFGWSSQFLECVELAHLVRPVVMIPSVIAEAGAARRRQPVATYHLLE